VSGIRTPWARRSLRFLRSLRSLRDDDRGSAASELIVLTVVSFAFVLVIVLAGRVNVGSAHTEAAARAAARTISLARDPASAVGRAEDEAALIAEEGSAVCETMTFDPDITAAQVTVTVTCQVDLSEVANLLKVGAEHEVTGTATESIDPYREAT
jgi:Flp pilus assembly protein TadG